MEAGTGLTEEMNPGHKAARAPEIGLLWSILLTPIAGAIFWSINWSRLGKPKNRWWTWLSMIGVFIVYFVLLAEHLTWLGMLLLFAWDGLIYGLQKRITPSGVRSIAAWVVVIIFALLEFVSSFLSSSTALNFGGSPSSIMFGTSIDQNSTNLNVSGTDFKPFTTLYARIYDSSKFNSSTMTIMLEKKYGNGNGWTEIQNRSITISPNDNVYVEPFTVAQAGTYQVQAIVNNGVIAENTVHVG